MLGRKIAGQVESVADEYSLWHLTWYTWEGAGTVVLYPEVNIACNYWLLYTCDGPSKAQDLHQGVPLRTRLWLKGRWGECQN